jgi:hypothetical protein
MMASRMEMRVMWIAVDGVHRKKNAPIAWVVLIPTNASAVFVDKIFVKVSTVVRNVKNFRSSIIVPTCTDGVKNGNESDVDCGSSCLSSKCDNGSTCNAAQDCISAICTSNICQGKYSYL